MKKSIVSIFVSILFLLTVQGTGICADKGYIGLQFGPQFLTDDDHGDADNALALGIYGGYRVDRNISLEASLNTASHDIDHGGDLTVTSLTFGGRLNGKIDQNLVVYAGAGLGIYPIHYDHHWYHDNYYGSHSETEAGLYLGGGLEFPIQKNLRIGLDLKYNALFDDDTLDSDIFTMMIRLGIDI